MSSFKPTFSWDTGRDFLLITAGAILQALALNLFLVPARLASGGISGIAQIINAYTGWPIGVMVLIGNIPLFLLGWRFLGGRRFVLRTAYAIAAFSFLTDFLARYLPAQGLTPDILLNALYGGVVSGIGYGLVYRGRGTSGGSDILARILNHWRGISIAQSYMLIDSFVILAAGLSFSWENAMYSLVTLFISGIAAERALEGENVVRTALIITDHPDQITQYILYDMERGVTLLPATGAYTGVGRTVLYTVISRAEVAQLKSIVNDVDPQAFMVIGQANEALGEGFKHLESTNP
jgi:uncharacterized membrane-anchored protein YitT (DUF2179 family)